MRSENFILIGSLVLFLTLFLVIIGTSISEESNKNSAVDKNKSVEPKEILQKREERIKIKSFYQIKSKEDLMAYREMKMEEMKEILRSTNQEKYAAILTFNGPLTLSELNNIVNKHSLEVSMVRYKSTEGGGEMPFEMVKDEEEIRIMESKIRELMRQINHTGEFRLIEGFTAAKVSIPRNEIIPLSQNPNIFLVDLGPKELYENESVVAEWVDVAHYVEIFSDNYTLFSGNRIKQEHDYNTYLIIAIILITIFSSLAVIYYKKFRYTTKDDILKMFLKVKGKSIVQAMILLLLFLLILPFTPIPMLYDDISGIIALCCIFLFLFLFSVFLFIPIKKFKRKRDWVEWLNIFCIAGIVYMVLIWIINSGITKYIGEHEIHFYAIVPIVFFCGLPLLLTFILYFFRNLKAYLFVAFISVILFIIELFILFISMYENNTVTPKIPIENCLFVISHFFRSILTMAIIMRNLDSIERIE